MQLRRFSRFLNAAIVALVLLSALRIAAAAARAQLLSLAQQSDSSRPRAPAAHGFSFGADDDGRTDPHSGVLPDEAAMALGHVAASPVPLALRSAPSIEAKITSSLPANEPILIVRESGDFLFVMHQEASGIVTGWIKRSDLKKP